MIRLIAMDEAHYQACSNIAIAEYAQHQVDVGDWTIENARDLATKGYHELLPDGLNSKDKYLFSIEDEATKTIVGMLGFAVMERGGQRSTFVFDVKIDEAFRRHGYGEQAFRALETKVCELGLHTISLHVFGHNLPARAMYEKLGYITTHVQMTKNI